MGISMSKYGLLGLTFTSVVAIASANAADMYVPGPVGPGGYKDTPWAPTWAGFYVGVNGGYAFGSGSQQIIDTNSVGAIDIFRTAEPSGGFGGGQIGYNWQGAFGSRLVLGVEADFQGAGIEGEHTGIGTAAGLETNRVNIDWFGTVRGRLGYAFDRTLVYATGGLAYGDVDSRLSSPNAPGIFERKHDTQVGFVAGAGVEYKITPVWSVKAEYQYIDLGSERLVGTPGFAGFHTNDLDTAFHTVRVGLNYHIAPAYEPLK
jgi:outer membrane immunogenic protein